MPTDRIDPTEGAIFSPHAPRPGRITSDRDGSVGRDLADLLAPWVLGVVTLVARLWTAATGPTDWDSAQYAAAVARFDVTHGRPQPPGYFLYIAAGRLLHATGPGAVDSLVVVSAVASAVGVGLVVVAGRDLGGRWVGLAAGLVVATSPFAWFNGSIVATYSFDLLIAPLLISLAWRARPHSWHGAAALASLGLAAGFRQSAVQSFGVLALLAVAGSVRRVREAAKAVVAGAVAIGAWFIPMAITQPGGVSTWMHATQIEARGAVRATSVFDHASGSATNLGTFAGYTTVALALLTVLAVLSGSVLGVGALVRWRSGTIEEFDAGSVPAVMPAGPDATDVPIGAGPASDTAGGSPANGTANGEGTGWSRPWFQTRTAVLVAAIGPPMALVAFVQFAKGGYLLAFLPGAVIALLLVPAAVFRRPDVGLRSDRPLRMGPASTVWLAVATLSVTGIAVFGTQRFLTGTGVLPSGTSQTADGIWLAQARYQAPYPSTRSAIRSMDAIDTALAKLADFVHPDRDVVVIDSLDGGPAFYRNAGWELPRDRVALIVPGAAIYNEQYGSLYYTLRRTVPVGPGGVVFLISPPSLPGLAQLAGTGQAVQVTRAAPIADYRVWRITPGASILGVRVVVAAGHRPLGSGIEH